MNADGIRTASRMEGIEPFYVMDVLARARALERRGHRVIHLEIGEPDFPTPKPILDAAHRALANEWLPYTEALGLPALRERIARHYADRFGVDVSSERVVITAGSSAALLLALAVVVNPGEEVLVADPGYPCNRQIARVLGAIPVGLPVDADSAFQPTVAQVAEGLSDKVAAVLVASPANPTGTLIPEDTLRTLAELCAKRRVGLIVDEIYQGLTYESEATTALALSSDLFVVNSFSKYFDMTGFRLGWAVVPDGYVRAMEKLSQNLFICASTVAQNAAVVAFHPETLGVLEDHRREFRRRRDFLVPALRDMGFDLPLTPAGAFYCYAGCRRFTQDSYAFALQLLEDAHVAVTPGRDFGSHRAEEHVRFAYTTDLASIEEGVRRLRGFLRGT